MSAFGGHQLRREFIVEDVEKMALFFGDEGLGMALKSMATNSAVLETPEVHLSLVKRDSTQAAFMRTEETLSLTVHDIVESVERARRFGGDWNNGYEFVREYVARAVVFSPEGHRLHLHQIFTYVPEGMEGV